MKKQEENYQNLKDFFDKNSNIFTVLSIFLIFISISGKDFLPELNFGIKLSGLSEFLWLSGVLIVIVCLVTLIKESRIKENPTSIKLFGSILFIALFCISMYTFFYAVLSENISLLFKFAPNNVLIALLVVISPFIFVLINKIKLKWLFWIVYLIVPVASLFFLLEGGIQNWSNQLTTLNVFYWFVSAILISFCLSVYYKVLDWRIKTYKK